MLLTRVEHFLCVLVFISRSRQQVCDAPRCPGLHAHDNAVLNRCHMPMMDWFTHAFAGFSGSWVANLDAKWNSKAHDVIGTGD